MLSLLSFVYLFSMAQRSELDNRFIDRYFSAKGEIPLSFKIANGSSHSGYNGLKPVIEDKAMAGYVERTIKYKERNGLSIRIVAKIYPDFDAVEWVGWIKNERTVNSPMINNIDICHVIPGISDENANVFWNRGSAHEINDFEPMQSIIGKDPVIFGTNSGRSSDTENLPFFNLASENSGVVVGIGWTGSWFSQIQKQPGKGLEVTAGFSRKFNFYLKPGEEIRTPSVLFMFWEGKDRMIGHNAFRRLVLRHYTPQTNNKPVQLPIAFTLGNGGPKPCVEFNCSSEEYAKLIINRFDEFELHPDLFWIDAGWYPCSRSRWDLFVGSWTPDPKRFPNGFKSISDLAKKYGAGFLLWFEPERVYEGSWLHENKKEWLLKSSGSQFLLNLANPEAVEWVSNMVINYIKKDGLAWYRQDFNMRPNSSWEMNDETNRSGILEIKHIMGLYQFWDNIRAACPDIQIDNCASGGRRIDLETIKRSVPLWRTDYEYNEPIGYQSQTYGLSFFLPCHTTGGYSEPIPYRYRSGMTNGIITSWSITQDKFDVQTAIELLKEHREIRDFFYGDFYPLTTYRTHKHCWMGYQFNSPDKKAGIALLFRRDEAVENSFLVKLSGLESDSAYQFLLKDYGVTYQRSGRELMEDGIDIIIPNKPSSLLIQYKICN
ncbi:MAG TPA: alpha-galactosidase [Prolixibacteraceae bacterium]|nr:alpha-galactosidase [Prolixibacteraceae bacterium]